ncbi:MAG: NAD-dependent epimerase/dehydratase family protein [Leptolyngbyaceae cyanobacterium MO_188.B28]|nr:NAD-dependent epimerase/dehydratase family protein [Leptolyngbyaceae cyanobacterium MO_188.B28]
MKAAIIGCGYVGSTVAQRWRGQGLSVLATTTRGERVSELENVADQVEVVRGTDAKRLQSLLADRQVVLVCVGSKRGANYAETYLGTAKTLAQVLPSTMVQQLIYTSTYSVYGQHNGAWVTEDSPAVPATDNGRIILSTEQTLLETMTPQRQVCILRLGGIYGPGRTLEKIYSRAAGKTRPGKGDEGSNWVHLHDIVGAIDWVRQHRLAGLYNLVQDEILTVRELISAVCKRHRLDPVKWDESKPSDRPYNVRVSNSKLKGTGYRFVHPTFTFRP